MKSRKIRVFAVLALILVLGIAAAQAQQGNQARAANREGIAQNLGIQEFLRGLRLTEAQRDQVKAILQDHRNGFLAVREALLQARLALVKEAPNGPHDFGLAQSKMMELRQQILMQIKTVLTPDQLAVYQERQERQAERIQRMLDRLRQRGKV